MALVSARCVVYIAADSAPCTSEEGVTNTVSGKWLKRNLRERKKERSRKNKKKKRLKNSKLI
jgi:hypothetical protein